MMVVNALIKILICDERPCKKISFIKRIFLNLDSSYRKIFADNLEIVDSEKVKERIKS